MAILQSTLSEEILSRQERAVVRGIYHAAQMNEALVAVIKINESLSRHLWTICPNAFQSIRLNMS